MPNFENLMQKRRSVYHLGRNVTESHEEMICLVKECVYNAPSAFNSQSARTVILFGARNHAFWDHVKQTLKAIVPADKFAPTAGKIDSFGAGIGTVLFFEETKIIDSLGQKFPTYKDKFPDWSQQGNAILQYMVWTAFAEKEIGASLQHYNPLIDNSTRQMFDLPPTWQLIAQMPFGSIEQTPDAKTHEPLEKRVKVFE